MLGLATTIVVPCYNEARRFAAEPFLALARDSAVRLILVDDGSTDDTRARLESASAQDPERVTVLGLNRNRGKAEAVRIGLNTAMAGGSEVVGYLDGDGATPVAEMSALQAVIESSGARAVLGSRVKLLGRTIERSNVRHYVGRIFATIASSVVLRIPVYDTQCGAKLFRVCGALRSALAEPFLSHWTFDVELLGRLLYTAPPGECLTPGDLVEVPLRCWRDIPGSKVKLWSGLQAAWDLARLAVFFRKAERHGW